MKDTQIKFVSREMTPFKFTITSETLSRIAPVMIYLAEQKRPLKLLINSYGGEVTAGLGICDEIRNIYLISPHEQNNPFI